MHQMHTKHRPEINKKDQQKDGNLHWPVLCRMKLWRWKLSSTPAVHILQDPGRAWRWRCQLSLHSRDCASSSEAAKRPWEQQVEWDGRELHNDAPFPPKTPCSSQWWRKCVWVPSLVVIAVVLNLWGKVSRHNQLSAIRQAGFFS